VTRPANRHSCLTLMRLEGTDRMTTDFDGLVVGPLGPKPWGATDGQVVDRFRLYCLVGYEPDV
jgi:hypothetical protein